MKKEKKVVQLCIRVYEKDLQALKEICPKNLSYAVQLCIRNWESKQLA